MMLFWGLICMIHSFSRPPGSVKGKQIGVAAAWGLICMYYIAGRSHVITRTLEHGMALVAYPSTI